MYPLSFGLFCGHLEVVQVFNFNVRLLHRDEKQKLLFIIVNMKVFEAFEAVREGNFYLRIATSY